MDGTNDLKKRNSNNSGINNHNNNINGNSGSIKKTTTKIVKIYENSILKNERLERRAISQEPDLITSTLKQNKKFPLNKENINEQQQQQQQQQQHDINQDNYNENNELYNTNNNAKLKFNNNKKQNLMGAKRNFYNVNNDSNEIDDNNDDYNHKNYDRTKQITSSSLTTNNRQSSVLRKNSSSGSSNSSRLSNDFNDDSKNNCLNNDLNNKNLQYSQHHYHQHQQNNIENVENFIRDEKKNFTINIKIDVISSILFVIALLTRLYKLSTPNNVVFDELHYGKYVSHYMKNTFFFDQHPPLGKQLIAGLAHLAGYNGNFTFSRIGSEYTKNVPIFWLRLLPALCGSLLSPVSYEILLEMHLSRWTALLGGLLIILDNSLLTQSRFILMESMLLLFSSIGILYLLRFQRSKFASATWIYYGALSTTFFTFALSVKYAGFYSCALACLVMARYLWNLLHDTNVSDFHIILQTLTRWLMFTIIPIVIYISIFYIHLSVLHKAGPHDNVMTSAFQASLDGGLASITKGQPLKVVHGSQITLRHTYGRTCWLHSHMHVYPVKYADNRGSSHQQQITCYSFKDVNNWWIVKRPERDDLVADADPDTIKHGDIIQLVHGITSRGLNSHDVAGPMTPSSQEVSCYIDYNISMSAELLWKVEIVNRKSEGSIWHAIRSEVRLIHHTTNMALRFSGKQLPDWGFNQHEVVADRDHEHQDTIWNVEEHRHTKSQDQKERERQLINAEMIPTKKVFLSFWQKFMELHTKMLWYSDQMTSHMYSSEVLEWPLLDKGIAYWIDRDSNGQIHLLGNILIWYSGTLSIFIYIGFLIWYLIRRRRLCNDLPQMEWYKFTRVGEIFLGGYLLHYLPYFFVDRTLFLHNYLPAFLFKLLLLCYIIEHLHFILKNYVRIKIVTGLYKICIGIWLMAVFYIYTKFLSISYGIQKLSADEIIDLRWKDTWDFILRKDLE